MKRTDPAVYTRRLKDKYKGQYLALEPYAKRIAEVKHKCTKCQATFQRSPHAMLVGKCRCPGCGVDTRNRAPKDNAESYQAWLDENDGLLTLMGEYKGTMIKTEHRCKNHPEYIYVSKPMNVRIKPGKGCSKCGIQSVERKLGKTHKQYLRELKALGIAWKPLEEYAGAQTAILHECCGETRIITPTVVLCKRAICAVCSDRTNKLYQLGSSLVQVKGYEPFALDYLISIGIKPKEIVVTSMEGMPVIPYTYKQREHNHYPDIYLPRRNLLLEVKSNFTLGLTRRQVYGSEPIKVFKRNKAKAIAAEAFGFDYQVLLVKEDKTVTPLPSNWLSLSRAAMKLVVM
jgi:hypothetical protein